MKLFEEMTIEECRVYLKKMGENIAKQKLVPDGWYDGLTEQDWLDIIKAGTIVDLGPSEYIGFGPIKQELVVMADPITPSLLSRIKQFVKGLFG